MIALCLPVLLLFSGSAAASGGESWLDGSNPAGNLLFDPPLATEIHSFWYVAASQINSAAQMLAAQPVVPISPDRAAPLIGGVPKIPAGETLYLIRAIDVADPTPLHVYQLGAWVQVIASTRSTCFIFRPTIRRQPVVVALPKEPNRLRLKYSCGG